VRRITALLPVAVAALLSTGCGGGTDESAAVRATVVKYGNDVAAKDYTAVCRLFAPNLLQQMASINLPCETALSHSNLPRVIKPTLTVVSVKVTGQSALAKVHTDAANEQPADTTIGLVKVASDWRIASLTSPPTTPPASTTPTTPTKATKTAPSTAKPPKASKRAASSSKSK
jgi:ketosteroid isomerase-like protein